MCVDNHPVTDIMSTSGTKGWRELRHHLGAQEDRGELIRFLCAATGYEPLPHQLRAHLAYAPGEGAISHKLILGGIGSGKSYWGACETIALAIANVGCDLAVLAPTYDQIMHVIVPTLRELFDSMARRGYPLARKWSASKSCFELVGGGRLYARSYSRCDSIRGFTLCAVHLDETSMARRPAYVFDTLVGRLRDRRANKLQIHVTTTPRGLQGVVAKFVQHRHNALELSPERASFERRAWWVGRAPTMANTHLPAGYIESLKAGYSRRQWEQEVEAKVFMRPEGPVYPEFSRDRHLRPHRYDPAIGDYDLAIDWGYRHPAVLFIQRIPGTQDAVVFDEFVRDGVTRDHLRAYIRHACGQLGRDPANIAADRASKDQNQWCVATFPGSRLHVMRSRASQAILHGVERVRTMLDPVERAPLLYVATHLADADEPRGIVRSFESYRYKKRADGMVSSEPHHEALASHAMDAIRYWVVGCGSEERQAFDFERNHGARSRRGAFERPRTAY